MRERFVASLTRAFLLVSFLFDVFTLIVVRANFADSTDTVIGYWPTFSPGWGDRYDLGSRLLWLVLAWLVVVALAPLKLLEKKVLADKWDAAVHRALRVLLMVSAALICTQVLFQLLYSRLSVIGLLVMSTRAGVMAVTALLLAVRVQPDALLVPVKESAPPPPVIEPPVQLPPLPVELPPEPEPVRAAPLPPPAPAPLVRKPPAPGTCAGCAAPVTAWTCSRCGAIVTLDGTVVQRVLSVRPHGRTYLARTSDGAMVVIKELVLARAAGIAVVEAFEREARLLAGLKHPRLPKFLAHLQRTDEAGALRLITIMTLLEGTPLDQLAEEQRLTNVQLVDFLRQGLDLLVYLQARQQPILHRDLKPSNLLVSPDGALCLVDFGVARYVEGKGYDGTMVGTVGFIPPEQLAGRVDKRSDPYALAMTVICLLTGTDPVQLMTDTGAVSVPKLPTIHARVARVLRKMVARSPEARFPDAKAARAALDAVPVGNFVVGAVAVACLLGGVVVAKRSFSDRKTVPLVPISAAVSPRAEPTPPPAPAPAPDVVIARSNDVVVTAAAVQAEFDRLPPVLLEGAADFRASLVHSVAVQLRLQQVATDQGMPQGDFLGRLRALVLVRKPSGGIDPIESRAKFERLVETIPQPEIINSAALAAIKPSRDATLYREQVTSPRQLTIWLGQFIVLRGYVSNDGMFVLSWPEAPVGTDGFAPNLPPLDWLYIELLEPDLTRGNYVVHDRPSTIVAAGSIATGQPSPQPNAYLVKLDSMRTQGLDEDDVRLAYRHVDTAVAHCLTLAAEDSRLASGVAVFSLSVVDGVMNASAPSWEEAFPLEADARTDFTRTDHGQWCRYALTRWRFPKDVTGKATVRIRLAPDR